MPCQSVVLQPETVNVPVLLPLLLAPYPLRGQGVFTEPYLRVMQLIKEFISHRQKCFKDGV